MLDKDVKSFCSVSWVLAAGYVGEKESPAEIRKLEQEEGDIHASFCQQVLGRHQATNKGRQIQ
jgi:hypothetical protein